MGEAKQAGAEGSGPQACSDPSDLELIAAINAGDAAAFETLYYRYRDWVVALACRFTGDPDTALDVLQETFLYVLRKFPGFKLTAQFKTFLYPAVRNLALAARKKTQRYQATEADLQALAASPAPTSAPTSPAGVVELLTFLSEEQREVLILRFVDGLTLEEISQALGIPPGTVKSRVHYALQTLREDARTKHLVAD